MIESSEKLRSRDSLYAYCFIGSLMDTELSDCEFAERVFSISNYLNFMFCGIDCQDSLWLELPLSRRDSVRKIIIQGYDNYRNSCLFMADFEYDLCSAINLYDYCNMRLILEKEYQFELEEAFKKVCRDCR